MTLKSFNIVLFSPLSGLTPVSQIEFCQDAHNVVHDCSRANRKRLSDFLICRTPKQKEEYIRFPAGKTGIGHCRVRRQSRCFSYICD